MLSKLNSNIRPAAILLAILGGGTAHATLSHTGSVSTISPSDYLAIGSSGNGQVLINGHTHIQTQGASIGQASGRTGVLTVQGPDAKYRAVYYNSGDIRVGDYGNGHLNVTNGGFVSTDDDLYIATRTGSTGIVQAHGAGTQIKVRDTIKVGYAGNGQLRISQGAQVETRNATYVGYRSGATGYVNVGGAGSLLDIHCGVRIGYYGNGRMDIQDGGRVQNHGTAVVGYKHNSQGILNVADRGSVFTTYSSRLVNGYCGTGRIDISNGGQVFNTRGDYRNNAISTLAFGLSADYLADDFWAMNTAGDILSLGLLDVYLSSGYELGANQTYNMFNVAGTTSSMFTGYGQDSSLGVFGDHELYISYTGGNGNDIVFYTLDDPTHGGEPSAVPEPVSIALGSMGLLALARRTSRRSK